MTDPSASQWILLLSLTALLLSIAVLSQAASRYVVGYRAARLEIASFLDAVDSSVSENESYDRDVAGVRRLEDKLRLGRLLREIQRAGDDLREDLSGLLVDGGDGSGSDDKEPPRPRVAARLLWAGKRLGLEDRLRRLDLLRMRFLVVYLGVVAAETAARQQQQQQQQGDPEKAALRKASGPPWAALSDSIREKPPLRRSATNAFGHQDAMATPHKAGWAGVVRELQRSPLLQKRHTSVEMSIGRTP